jgi:hypothetical protein
MNFKKAVKIVCLQQGIAYKNLADRIGLTLNELKVALRNKESTYHARIARYVYDNLDTKNVTLKVHCELNEITMKEFCKENNICYSSIYNQDLGEEQIENFIGAKA